MESAIAATFIITFRLIEFGLHYADVSNETSELLNNVELVDRKVNSARYLRRIKSGWLDSRMKEEVEKDIETAEESLKSIALTIERCRKDLVAENRVTALNKLRWLFRDNQAFLSKERTLSNSLIALTSDIHSMTAINVVEPPSYESATRFRGALRGPTVRRHLAKQKSAASFTTPDQLDGSGMGWQHRYNTSTSSLSTVQTHDGHLSLPSMTQYSDWTGTAASVNVTAVRTHDGHLSLPQAIPPGHWRDASTSATANSLRGHHGRWSLSALDSVKDIWKPSPDYALNEDEDEPQQKSMSEPEPEAQPEPRREAVYELDGGYTGFPATHAPAISTTQARPKRRRLRSAGI